MGWQEMDNDEDCFITEEEIQEFQKLKEVLRLLWFPVSLIKVMKYERHYHCKWNIRCFAGQDWHQECHGGIT